MNTTIKHGARHGSVSIPASKSQMHRLLICAALGSGPVTIEFDGLSNDIEATVNCLDALGADIKVSGESGLYVSPITAVTESVCHLFCGESGSTLRFLLPIVGALGTEAVFHMEGRLPERPLAPLDKVLTEHGMTLRKEGALLHCSGQLKPGEYSIPGNISSQYVTGLLMALPMLGADSVLRVTGKVESAAYIAMTEDVLAAAGIRWQKTDWEYTVPHGQRCKLPENCRAEGDYSNAAFFLCMGALSDEGVTVTGLLPTSHQGDRTVLDVLHSFGAQVAETDSGISVKKGELNGITIDAAPIPDLIPVLSVVAAAAKGETHIINAARLRLKESDRLKSTSDLLTALGADVTELEDGLVICGDKPLKGGTVSSWGDHRIAMSAAVAASVCTNDVTVVGSECTAKSYPRFWTDLDLLKGASL